MPQPKKRAARKSLSRHAWITLDGGFAARHCLVQDISDTGAKIMLDEDASQLPGVIRMAFARDARDRAELPGDLAPRQIGGRQVHLIPGEATRMARGAGPG